MKDKVELLIKEKIKDCKISRIRSFLNLAYGQDDSGLVEALRLDGGV